jgi:hypothetical protein
MKHGEVREWTGKGTDLLGWSSAKLSFKRNHLSRVYLFIYLFIYFCGIGV